MTYASQSKVLGKEEITVDAKKYKKTLFNIGYYNIKYIFANQSRKGDTSFPWDFNW